MKATLTFDLTGDPNRGEDGEHTDLLIALHATDYRATLSQIDVFCRGRLKHAKLSKGGREDLEHVIYLVSEMEMTLP